MPRFHAAVVCCTGNGEAHQVCSTFPIGYYGTRKEAQEAGEYAAGQYNRVADETCEFYAYRVRVVPDDEW
jgi:hypothetical protein